MKLPDYNELLDIHEAEQQQELEKLPECACCGEHIQQDFAIVFGFNWFCDSCIKDYYTKDVESYKA